MIFRVKEPIMKAAPRKPLRTPRRVERLSDRMAGAISIDFAKGIRTFKAKVKPEEVLRAWTQGSYGDIMAVIPWEEMFDDLSEVHSKMKVTMQDAAEPAIESLPPPVQPLLRYDVKNPRIDTYLNRRTGDLIEGIKNNTQRAIQDAVRSSFTTAATPRDIANQIKDSIGLLPQHERAVRNYMSGLSQKGYPPMSIQKLGAAKYEKLLDYRAMMIGRTEAAYAANFGQLFVWQQATSEGLIPKEAKKVWTVMGPDPCELCDPMDGDAIGLNEFWTLDDGTVCEVPNESHPHCYCKMTLDYGEMAESA